MNVYVYFALCFPLAIYGYKTKKERKAAKVDNLLPPVTNWEWRSMLIVSLLAFLDCSSRLMSFIAASFISGSVVLLIKGSRIVWTSILSLFIIPNKRLYAYNWAAVLLAMLGVFFVGFSVFGNKRSSGNVGVGLAIAISGEVVRATHMVLEELLIKGKYQLDPLFFVGMRGIWGFFIMAPVLLLSTFVLMKSAASGEDVPLEDLYDTVYMIGNSWKLGLLLGIMLFHVFYSGSGNCQHHQAPLFNPQFTL